MKIKIKIELHMLWGGVPGCRRVIKQLKQFGK